MRKSLLNYSYSNIALGGSGIQLSLGINQGMLLEQ